MTTEERLAKKQCKQDAAIITQQEKKAKTALKLQVKKQSVKVKKIPKKRTSTSSARMQLQTPAVNTSMFETSGDTVMKNETTTPVFEEFDRILNTGDAISDELRVDINGLKALVDTFKKATDKRIEQLKKKHDDTVLEIQKLSWKSNESMITEHKKQSDAMKADLVAEHEEIQNTLQDTIEGQKIDINDLKSDLTYMTTTAQGRYDALMRATKQQEDVKCALNDYLYAKKAKHSYHKAGMICPISLEYLLPDDNVLSLIGCACHFIMKLHCADTIMKEFFANGGKRKCPTCGILCREMKFMTVEQAVMEVEWNKIHNLTGCNSNADVIARHGQKTFDDCTNKTAQDTAQVRHTNAKAIEELQAIVATFTANNPV